MNIYLIGYRGTGKSTVAVHLARLAGLPAIDADPLIEAEAGCTIREIFAHEGETGFRQREAQLLERLAAGPASVVATGGGIILRESNRQILRESGFVAWLTATPETLFQRIQADPTTSERRPALTSQGGIEEVRSLLAVREPLYNLAAHATFSTEGRSPEALALDIFNAWTTSCNSR